MDQFGQELTSAIHECFTRENLAAFAMLCAVMALIFMGWGSL